jgi:hypothetical protein
VSKSNLPRNGNGLRCPGCPTPSGPTKSSGSATSPDQPGTPPQMLPKALPTVPYFGRVQPQPVRQRSNQAARQPLCNGPRGKSSDRLSNRCPPATGPQHRPPRRGPPGTPPVGVQDIHNSKRGKLALTTCHRSRKVMASCHREMASCHRTETTRGNYSATAIYATAKLAGNLPALWGGDGKL